MKAYIVIKFDLFDYDNEIVKVFMNEQKAKDYIDQQKKYKNIGYEIEIHEME